LSNAAAAPIAIDWRNAATILNPYLHSVNRLLAVCNLGIIQWCGHQRTACAAGEATKPHFGAFAVCFTQALLPVIATALH
jgi:hypothetical protein